MLSVVLLYRSVSDIITLYAFVFEFDVHLLYEGFPVLIERTVYP